MAIKYMNYTVIPASRRQVRGNQLLLSLRASLRNPALTGEQVTAIEADITTVNAWIAGTLTVLALPNVPEHNPPEGPPPLDDR